MAVPKVLVLVRQRVEGRRAYVCAQDDKGKLLQLPGTYYLRYNQHGKSQWQRVGSFIERASHRAAARQYHRKTPPCSLVPRDKHREPFGSCGPNDRSASGGVDRVPAPP